MKKIFTLFAAVLLASTISAAYEPSADEVIYLQNDAYDANATEAGFSKHAAISWAGTVSWSDKKAGDPANDGAITSSSVKTCSVKGNGGGKNLTISIEGCSGIVIYHEKQSSRYVELREGSKTGTLLGKSVSNATYTELTLDASTSYSIFLHGVKEDGGDQDFYVYAVKLIKGQDDGQPKLNVSPESIALHATASNTNPSAKVVFSGKNLAAGNYALSVPDLAGLSVNPTSVTVGNDGKLNAEVTISYTSAVAVAAASTSVDLTIGSLTKVVTIDYSAVLTKQYMTSINIEQFVLDNGTNANITAALEAAHIEYNNIDALDTLNDLENKANRNYAFLGLKMKKADAKLAGWLQAGQTIKVRFGNVGANFKVSAAGMDSTCTADNFANATTESNKVLEFTAPVDMYLEIACNSTKTLVVKQIMINQEIAPVVLPAPGAFLVTVADAENGTVAVSWDNKKYRTPVGALVTLTPHPEAGYKTVSLTWNGTQLHDEAVGYVTFTMPAEDVTVVAEFDTDFPTVVENVEVSEKAIKRIENGQLFIIKNGVKYDALGQIVK